MPHLVGVRVALRMRCPQKQGLVTPHELMADRAGAWLLAAMLQRSRVSRSRDTFLTGRAACVVDYAAELASHVLASERRIDSSTALGSRP